MDDNESDPGTFVSMENFVTSAAPSPLPFTTTISDMVPNTLGRRISQRTSTSSLRHDSSFNWTLFGSQGDDDTQTTRGSNVDKIQSDQVDDITNPDHEADTESQSHKANESDNSGLRDDDETISDRSDDCVEFGGTGTACTPFTDPSLHPSMSPQTHFSSALRNLPSGSAESTQPISSWNDTPGEQIDFATPAPEVASNLPQAAENVAGQLDDIMDANVATSSPSANKNMNKFEKVDGVKPFAVDEFLNEVDKRRHLLMASSGLTSFQVDLPSNFSEHPVSPADVLTLFSRTGPFKQDERYAFGNLASDESPQSRMLAKLLDTIQFQRMELSNLQTSAVEITESIVDKQRSSYSEAERHQATIMHMFFTHIQDDRDRFKHTEEEKEHLKEKVSSLNHLLEDIVEFGKQFRPDFSFSKGAKAALEPLFANQVTRRQSADIIARESRQMQDLQSRVLSLENLLDRARARTSEIEKENQCLTDQVQELEGISERGAEFSPEPTPKLLLPRQSPERAGALERAVERIAELESENSALSAHVKAVSAEKAKVDDAILSLNVDLQESCRRNATLRDQRNVAERETRQVERERRKDREKYEMMEQAIGQNMINAASDLDEKEGKIQRMEKELEERETVIKQLHTNTAELDNNLNSLTQAAIESSQRSRLDHDSKDNSIRIVVDGVLQTLRGELSRAQRLLDDKSRDLADLKTRVANQDEKTFSLRRECDRFRAVAATKSNVFESSRETHLKQQQIAFLHRLSDTLGYRPENSKDFIEKLVGRVEKLVEERSEFESSAVKLRSEVLQRERTLYVVRSEMQGEISTLKAEVQHLTNVKNRVDEECKTAQAQVMELLQERDVSDIGSVGDITSSSIGTRRQSGHSLAGTWSRRESMYSMVGADNTIQWRDPIVVAAIQSLDQLVDLKDRLATRLRALRERQERMIRREGSSEVSPAAKAVIIESKELIDEIAGVVDGKQQLIDQLGASRTYDSTAELREADDTLPYISPDHVAKETQSSADITKRSVDGPIPFANVSNFAASRRESLAESTNVGKEAAGFLENQLKRTRTMYNEKSKANAALCGTIAELQQQIDHVIHEKRTAQEVLAQVSSDHRSFIARLAGISGTEESTVALEEFSRDAVQEIARLTGEYSALDKRSDRLVALRVQLVAEKKILAHMIDLYQTKYGLDILASSKQQLSSPKRRFRTAVLAVIAGLRVSKGSRPKLDLDVTSEIDISESYQVPALALIARHRDTEVPLMDAIIALTAVPRLEEALQDREREIGRLSSALAALDMSAVPAIPEDIRNGIQSSFVYHADVVNRKDDLARRLNKALKELTELEVRASQEREKRMAAEKKTVRYCDKLVATKKKLYKANSNADSKERTYKAAIKFLKHKADKAVESDRNIDENTDPWAAQTPPGKGAEGKNEFGVSSQEVDSLTLEFLQEQLARAERKLRSIEEGTPEYQQAMDRRDGVHNVMHRLRQNKRRQSLRPAVVNNNINVDGSSESFKG